MDQPTEQPAPNLEDRPWSSVSSAQRIAEFLRSSHGRITVVVETAAPVGLVWLAGVVPNGRPVRLLLGDGFTRRWAQEPPGEARGATAAFFTAHHIEVRFWQPAPKLGDPSVSVWHAEGPPTEALNATTQLEPACLHHHLDTISTIKRSDLGHVEGWIGALLTESQPPPASLFDSFAAAHDGQPFRFPPDLG